MSAMVIINLPEKVGDPKCICPLEFDKNKCFVHTN